MLSLVVGPNGCGHCQNKTPVDVYVCWLYGLFGTDFWLSRRLCGFSEAIIFSLMTSLAARATRQHVRAELLAVAVCSVAKFVVASDIVVTRE